MPNAPVRDPDVDANIPTKSIASPDTPDVPDVSVEGSSVDEESGGSLPNGDDKAPPKRRQRRDYGKDIRAYAIAHPNLGVEAIAKHFGCSRVRAERILGVDCCFVRGVP